MALTIGETIDRLHGSLRQYIEATYHIGNPQLIQQRLDLLNAPGVIHQQPFIESTPRYQSNESFSDLGLDADILRFFESLSQSGQGNAPLFFDPPYEHQAAAVRCALVEDKSLLVMTGTGSGKTECFLLPILGKLAREAKNSPATFAKPAVRALVLYPMNALVNDQLGRLRLIFGDQRVTDQFTSWADRPARFARYTSRTLYPGVRDTTKDSTRLKSIGSFYVNQLQLALGPPSDQQAAAADLVERLQDRGKWPAKEDLIAWYGTSHTRWKNADGEFIRGVTMPNDAELFTRHEVHQAPADVLVTNYSMLEYMMMRPLERPVFDQTRTWLEENPDESFLMVIDESHMYRGAGGAEVALLLRRVRTRLGIPPERFQVICTSASFKDEDYAIEFAARLSGKDVGDFAPPIQGELALRSPDATGQESDAQMLANIDLDAFHSARTDGEKKRVVANLLAARNTPDSDESIEQILHHALENYSPMGNLVNRTMQAACPISEIGSELFPDVPQKMADNAVTVLAALGSLARPEPNQPGLLPCRVHAFYRGLAGLWACLDPQCTALPESQRGAGPTGKLYAQPHDRCDCGASVLELFTCRNCGTAYGRAYTDDLMDPTYLWPEAGSAFRTSAGSVEELEPLDLLLEEPTSGEDSDFASFDLITGQINPAKPGERTRDVYLPKSRFDQPGPGNRDVRPGQFRPCGVCGGRAGFNRSSVQDHQTKGDEPFQALITEQIHVQVPTTPEVSEFAPLQGRKILVFSDSRQTAARLAPNLQNYSMRDVMRPLIIFGYAQLQRSPLLADRLNLEYLYLAVLLAAQQLGIRLRPALRASEPFTEMAEVKRAIENGAPDDDLILLNIAQDVLLSNPPHALLRAIVTTITDRFYGLESLALASLCESPGLSNEIVGLPNISTYAETNKQKLALARMWLRAWQPTGFYLHTMPADWNDDVYRTHSGKFTASVERFLEDRTSRSAFKRTWLPELRRLFAEQMSPNKYQLRGRNLSLQLDGEWAYCRRCRATQRPYPGMNRCVNCASDTVEIVDVETDSVFQARKGYYRASTLAALDENERNPMSLVAAEHTAQLNAAQPDEVFSKAEEHELLFQDVDLGRLDGHRDRTAIDILSCTTTMEVGIDIGALAGVALRNMPPARANYQQRSGRAGRRGMAVATVTAFGSADSHDEHYFSHPDQMIRGDVEDPILNVDNSDIARRHVTAFLLQRYHTDRLPEISPEEQPQLFAVLGTVRGFRDPESVLNIGYFSAWLHTSEERLRDELDGWLPAELDSTERTAMLNGFVEETVSIVSRAIVVQADGEPEPSSDDDDTDALEVQEEEGEEHPVTDPGTEDLLKRLLYEGILPRYAFPTDVATFHVFDEYESTRFRPVFQYAPSQGLTVALSQYAPGKQVWIDSRLWTSGAIYSVIASDRFEAWENRWLYFECERCHYSMKEAMAAAEKGDVRDCPACGSSDTFGPARHWMRPPGFAHPMGMPEGTSPDDQPAKSYATRAKLTAPTPSDESRWDRLNGQVRTYYLRDHLLVTNRGPKDEGYNYCTRCGRIEPSAIRQSTVLTPHPKPFPMPRNQACAGGRTATGIVLGTDFITDVLLMSIRVPEPMSLRPGLLSTDVALRTVCEALTAAACALLELEPSELQAEYRPALTEAGQLGHEAEIYIYDTLSGGAGFSRHVIDLGDQLFRRALTILTDCPENCDRSCYRCLRSYKNKFEHDSLDRFLGSMLLRYLLDGGDPSIDTTRLAGFVDTLYEDLRRQDRDDLTIERNVVLDIPEFGNVEAPILILDNSGAQLIVAAHSGLTPNYAPTPELRELSEFSFTPVHLVDEILIRQNLPTATRRVLELVSSSH